MAWQPLRQNHSIEAVRWRVVLLHLLGQRHQAWIRDKDKRLCTVLPRVETSHRYLEVGPNGVTVYSENAPVDQNLPALLHYERYSTTGEVELRLEVDGRVVNVVSHSYSQWSKTGGVVNQILSDIGTALREADDLPISQLELEYRDMFWYSEAWHADALGELLVPDGQFVPEWAFKAGSVWHADQGWVAPVAGFRDETVVERMFLQGLHGTVSDEPHPLLVVHTTLRWGPGQEQALPLKMQDAFSPLEPVGNARKSAQDRFNVMHDRAVQMFRKVLQPTMQERIGLAKETLECL